MTARHGEHMSRTTLFRFFALDLVASCRRGPEPRGRQGVTTGAMSGIVKAAAPYSRRDRLAVHQPSGITYEAVTQVDGRFPHAGDARRRAYTITASLTGFTSEARNYLRVSLGDTWIWNSSLKIAAVVETITVVGQRIRCSARAAPAPRRR